MTARLDVTPKTTEQNQIVCTSKSEAEVTNNKKTALEVLYYHTQQPSTLHINYRNMRFN